MARTTVNRVRLILAFVSRSTDQSLIFGRSSIEYLHLPAPRTQYVSEFGHLIRIASVHGRLEAALNAAGSKSIFANYFQVCSVLILVFSQFGL